MYIPLENLYDWVSNQSTDTVIYRFFPHGSKNLENIAPVDDSSRQRTSWEILRMPVMLCHDQEPLDFQRFNNLDWQLVRNTVKSKWTFVNEPSDPQHAEAFWRDRASYNIACMVNNGINDRIILLHSEQRSPAVDEFNQSQFITAYWWSHGMIARDWYRYAQYDQKLDQWPDQYPLDFNIYSRAWTGTREYRLYFLQQLVNLNLHPTARVTFADYDQDQHYQSYQFANNDFDSTLDLTGLDINNSIPGTSSATYDQKHYQHCAIDVVLETVFDDSRWHLTEKILRPIACGKPFILAATPGSLEYLKSYGFRTFAPWIDESYDQVESSQQRVHAIMQSMQEFAKLPSSIKSKHICEMQTIAQENRKHFFSDQFAQQIKQELVDNVARARFQIKQHFQTGKSYRANRLRMSRKDKIQMAAVTNQWHAHADARIECARLLRECRSRLGR